MSEKTYIILSVSKELNVGVATLAEHLRAAGFNVDNKPNAKLSEEQYQLLLSKFASEAKVKEMASQMKIDRVKNQQIVAQESQKPKINKLEEEEEQVLIKNAGAIRKLVPKPKIEPEEVIQPVETVKEIEKELPIEEEKTPDIPTPEVPAPNPVQELVADAIEDSKTVVKLKVINKIDLDSVKDKSKKSKTKKNESPEIVPAETKPEAKQEKKSKRKEKLELPKESETIAETPAALELPKTDIPTDTPQDIPADTSQDIPAEEKSDVKEDKKLITPNYKTLEGVKLMGKIELPVEKVKEKSSSSNDLDKKKRKRKKIGGEKIIIPADDKGGSRSTDKKDNRSRHGGGPVRRDAPKTEITDKEVQDKLKETLARMGGGGNRKPNIGEMRSKLRRQKRDHNAAVREEELREQELASKVLKVTEFLTANDLAKMMNMPITSIIQACFSLGMMVSINQRLDAETISIVADEFGYSVEFVSADVQDDDLEEKDNPEDLLPRPPIVTVMGHVDHGKTSLLDYIRNASVVAGEAGGITQHIGAYEVTLANGKNITFLDTPGHEAFTAMRARGAKITDVVIIVIAADDQVMPQTKEAISHAQAAGVPIIFALNKIDKEGANPEKIKEQLSQMNILVEDWGGKFQCQEISAKKGLNVDLLLDKVLLESELLDLKANPNKRASGVVLEASLDKGRGIVTTLMVQTGTLNIGDPILAGVHFGRVKAMFNERNQKITSVGPAAPVTVLGFPGAPTAGDKMHVPPTEHEGKEIANKRSQLLREQGLRTHKHITLDEIGRRLAIGNFKELNMIVKGDVDGSVEALSDSLLKLSTGEIQINVVHKAVGQISESDVLLASASDAIIIGFNVRPSTQARKLAESEDIDIRLYSIIYDAIEEVKSAMEGMLAPTVEERITCNVEVREVFKISKVGAVAGCMVTDGKISRNTKIRLIRDGVVVFTGELASLKRFKEDVKEVASGYDCGTSIKNFNDLKVGDVIEGYEQVEIKRKLNG